MRPYACGGADLAERRVAKNRRPHQDGRYQLVTAVVAAHEIRRSDIAPDVHAAKPYPRHPQLHGEQHAVRAARPPIDHDLAVGAARIRVP